MNIHYRVIFVTEGGVRLERDVSGAAFQSIIADGCVVERFTRLDAQGLPEGKTFDGIAKKGAGK